MSDPAVQDRAEGEAFLGDLAERYSAWSYRSAATVLERRAPAEADAIRSVLRAFRITETEIRMPGGNRAPSTARFGDLAEAAGFHTEVRIEADLDVRLWSGKSGGRLIGEQRRPDYIHNHMIDFWRGRVAFDYEWNSKDQTYDRDLYAFRSFFEAGVIDVAVIVTRDLPPSFFAGLGKVLKADGTEGDTTVAAKFGASTTGMHKLLTRMQAGRSGGCPVLAIGIREGSVEKGGAVVPPPEEDEGEGDDQLDLFP